MPRTILSTPRDLLSNTGTIIGGNLLRNGNMEVIPTGTIPTTAGKRWLNGTAAGSTTDSSTNWASGAVGANANVSFDTTVSHSGSASLRLHLGAAGSVAEAYSIGLYDTTSSIRQYAYPIHTGDYYSPGVEVTYWLKTNITSTGSNSTGASAGIFNWTGDGGIAGSGLNPVTVNFTQDWTQYRAVFALQNAGVRFIECRLTFAGDNGDKLLTGDAWFDDVQMKMLVPVYRAFV